MGVLGLKMALRGNVGKNGSTRNPSENQAGSMIIISRVRPDVNDQGRDVFLFCFATEDLMEAGMCAGDGTR
jgi:hypothetical protein